MRPLGVGLVYWAALDPLFGTDGPDLGVLELEPQTLWEKVCDNGVWQYRSNEALLDRVAELPQAKLLHGVGHPVGGTVADLIDPLPELRRAVQRLNPAWVTRTPELQPDPAQAGSRACRLLAAAAAIASGGARGGNQHRPFAPRT